MLEIIQIKLIPCIMLQISKNASRYNLRAKIGTCIAEIGLKLSENGENRAKPIVTTDQR